MAKRISDTESAGDKGGMRILYVELNGSNSSLQEGLRTLVAAMNKPAANAAAAPRRLVSNNNAVSGATPDGEPDLFNQAQESPKDADEPLIAEVPNSSSRRPRGEGPKKDRNAGIELVPELDLVQEGGTSLKEFYAEKAPSTAEEQVLVFAYYVKHHVKTSPIGPGHILTCYTHLDERKPLDLKQTIRNFAKSKGWLTCADMNDLKLTTAGENHVKHELGKGDKATKAGNR